MAVMNFHMKKVSTGYTADSQSPGSPRGTSALSAKSAPNPTNSEGPRG